MATPKTEKDQIPRRDFIKSSAISAMAVGALGVPGMAEVATGSGSKGMKGTEGTMAAPKAKYNTDYTGEKLNRIAFPMGGIGAGMICLEGSGALSHVSLRHRPEVFHEPAVFAAISVKRRGKPNVARVLEGPVPDWKKFGMGGSGNGSGGQTYGLPRFREATFRTRFPFAKVSLKETGIPVQVEITGWSPFDPGNSDDCSLPIVGLEYRFANPSRNAVEAVFSFNARNFMGVNGGDQAVKPTPGGFILWEGGPKERPWEAGAFCASVIGHDTKVNHAWFRGGWFDALTLAWKDVQDGAAFERPPDTEGGASPGGTIFVPLKLGAGESKTVTLQLSWFVPASNMRIGNDPDPKLQAFNSGDAATPNAHYRPFYTSRFGDIDDVAKYWRDSYTRLRGLSEHFASCFYDTSLPPEAVEAVAANLTILKSPTVLRQHDGRLWAWEGCADNNGCCHGSCTHVWNYAQAMPHLFPSLERSLRETEFAVSQNEEGHQQFRSNLPIRVVVHDFHAASDGQLGGIMKIHREWRISGNTVWMQRLWPKIKKSLDYCIETWDPGHKGWVEEPHHNTYDIEFWGPDGMCTSFYLGALAAAVSMGSAIGEDVSAYRELLAKGTKVAESDLYDGEYFIQKIEWKNLRAKNPLDTKSMVGNYTPEAVKLFEKEGPKYQYGNGCLSDGVLGSWMAAVCGVGQVLDSKKIASHLKALHKYNLKKDLSDYPNPQRPSYAMGNEGGLLLCTWPKGGELSLPFVYSNEVWTGIEYQAASHMIHMGLVEEGLDVVRTCRDRYDGKTRNPFNEYECGHWYARAMSSYALLQALTGARYDAVDKVLHLEPVLAGDYHGFLSTATGYGTVGVKDGKPFFDVKSGSVEVKEIKYKPATGRSSAAT